MTIPGTPAKLRLQMERLLSEPDLLVVGTGIRLMLPGGKIHDGRAGRRKSATGCCSATG